MREGGSVVGYVRYPNMVAFACSPNRVMVETNVDVTFTVGSYADVRSPMGGMIEIDISRYLQCMVSEDERWKDVSVTLSSSYGSFSFRMIVIWGARNVGDSWNVPEPVVWWRNFPMVHEFYLPSSDSLKSRYDGYGYESFNPSAEVSFSNGGSLMRLNPVDYWPMAMEKIVLRQEMLSQSSTFDYTFDETFKSMEGVTLREIKVSDDVCGIYLRWIDRHGWMRFWLFKEGKTSLSTAGQGEIRAYHEGEYEYAIIRHQTKQASRQIAICAEELDDDTFKMLEGVGSSPSVSWYIDGEWVKVSIANVTVSRGGKDARPKNDIEYMMVLPEVATQRL